MNNIKRVIFDIKSSKNIFWDDTPIRVGAQLVIPDKFKGDQPLCIISHGSGGLGSDTDLFVNSLGMQGIATLCVDSFTGRSMEAIGWNDFSSYVSPKMRAMETVEAYKFLCENHKNMFAGCVHSCPKNFCAVRAVVKEQKISDVHWMFVKLEVF